MQWISRIQKTHPRAWSCPHAQKALPQTESGVPRERKTIPWTDLFRRKVAVGPPRDQSGPPAPRPWPCPTSRPIARSAATSGTTTISPRSPAAIHKTNQCARATLLSDRADAYQQAELQKQVRETKEAWHRRQRRRRRYLAGQIRKDPLATVQKLKAFGTGLAYIIRSLELMLIELGNRGYLEPEGIEGVLLLFGIRPDDASICRNELAYFITLNALGCLPDQPAPDLAKWLEPANRPFPLRNKPREELMGADGDACRAAIVKRVQEELVPLRELHAQVVREVDEPALLEALQRASILNDEAARARGALSGRGPSDLPPGVAGPGQGPGERRRGGAARVRS